MVKRLSAAAKDLKAKFLTIKRVQAHCPLIEPSSQVGPKDCHHNFDKYDRFMAGYD
jgi:hypothetical protein